MVKKNITIVGLPIKLVKNVSKLLAEALDMFYADINELLEYEVDLPKAEKLVGKNYVKKLEGKTVKTVSSFENTVVNARFSTLTNKSNHLILQEKTLIVYLKFSSKLFNEALKGEELTKSKLKIEQEMFEVRDKTMSELAEVVVNAKNIKQKDLVKQIMKEVSKYYA